MNIGSLHVVYRFRDMYIRSCANWQLHYLCPVKQPELQSELVQPSFCFPKSQLAFIVSSYAQACRPCILDSDCIKSCCMQKIAPEISISSQLSSKKQGLSAARAKSLCLGRFKRFKDSSCWEPIVRSNRWDRIQIGWVFKQRRLDSTRKQSH